MHCWCWNAGVCKGTGTSVALVPVLSLSGSGQNSAVQVTRDQTWLQMHIFLPFTFINMSFLK